MSKVIRSEIRLSEHLNVQLLTSDFCIVPFGLSIQETFLNVWIQEEMRDTNESTNSRVLYFSLFSMCCLLGLATWQVRSQTTNSNFKFELSWLVDFSGALPEKILQVQEADRIGMEVITVRTEELWLLWTRVWLHVCGSNQHCRRDIWFWLMSYEV